MEVRIDGVRVNVPDGATILQACDAAGRSVPRLGTYPGIGCSIEMGLFCGLCVVEVEGGSGREEDRRPALSCCTAARPGMAVVTSGPVLRAERQRRLAAILEHHPHICLSCPDRDGCTREECTFGHPVEARCCAEFGRCEFGRLVEYIDPGLQLRRWPAVVPRESHTEGRIRREPGLCIGCGRCVLVCTKSAAAGGALQLEDTVALPAAGLVSYQSEELVRTRGRSRAVPLKATLRASGCTFCGQCVMVCPTGAVTAPGEAGARWLDGWRSKTGLPAPVLPPHSWQLLTEEELDSIPSVPGVFQLADDTGRVLRIGGVADLSRGVAMALTELTARTASRFRVERAELFTQRESELLARFAQEHGHLPPGNDLSDDLFGDDLFDEDPE